MVLPLVHKTPEAPDCYEVLLYAATTGCSFLDGLNAGEMKTIKIYF